MSDSIDTARLEEFLRKALEAQSSDPHDVPSEEDFKNIALRAGLSEEDWEKLCKALEAHLSRGRNFLEFGNGEDAVVELEEALKIAPYRSDVIGDCGRAHSLRWESQKDVESFARAESLLLQCLEMSPTDEVAAEALSLLRQRKQEKGSEKRGKKPIWIVAGATGLAALAAGVFAFWMQKGDPEPFPPNPVVVEVDQDPSLEKGVPDDAMRLGNRAFKIFREDVSWHEAKRRCEAMGGRLAVVNDHEALEVINERKRGLRLWLGATDEHEEGDWRWVDGTQVDIDAWSENQPFNLMGKEHYMELGPKGTFNDVGVNGPSERWRIQGFVCEWEVEETQELRIVVIPVES